MLKKKIAALALILAFVFSGTALAFQTENALTSRPEDSVYVVIKNDDLSGFLRWLASKENIKLLSEFSDEIDESMVEIVPAVVDNLSIKSIAILAGSDSKGEPFVQGALTLAPSVRVVADKIEVASAEAKDIATMLVGSGSPFIPLLETMIKVEHEQGRILKIDNTVFLKAEDGIVFFASSAKDVNDAFENFKSGENSLMKSFGRKFDGADNFVLVYCDYKTAAKFNEDDENIKKSLKYFEKPLKFEMGFDSQPEKLTVGIAVNLIEALNEKYSKQVNFSLEPVKGGNISLTGLSGNSSPFLAVGSVLNLSVEELDKDVAKAIKDVVKYLKVFGITEEDFYKLAKGAFSFVVGGSSVSVEGFKIPSVFISQTGDDGVAESIFDKLASKQFFSNAANTGNKWEKLIQADSSIPVSLLIGLNKNTLDIAVSEVSNLTDNDNLKVGLKNLMQRKSISSMWLDFAGLQDWINDESNGIFAILTPLAVFSGNGEYLAIARDLLSAKLSVPSVSFYSASQEVFFFEFDLAEINPDEGFLTKLASAYKRINALEKAKEKSKDKK